jgi:hypothetical protein
VRLFSTVDLANALEQEKVQGNAGRIAGTLLRLDLVVHLPRACIANTTTTKAAKPLHLFTAEQLAAGFSPWLNIESALWRCGHGIQAVSFPGGTARPRLSGSSQGSGHTASLIACARIAWRRKTTWLRLRPAQRSRSC